MTNLNKSYVNNKDNYKYDQFKWAGPNKSLDRENNVNKDSYCLTVDFGTTIYVAGTLPNMRVTHAHTHTIEVYIIENNMFIR